MIDLQINDVAMKFNCIGYEIHHDEEQCLLVITSSEVASVLNGALADVTLTAPPPPPVDKVVAQPVYEPTEKLGDYTIDDFIEEGWTHEQLVEKGYATVRMEVVSEDKPELSAPPPPDGKAPPPPKSNGKDLHRNISMTELAQGQTLESYLEAGWPLEKLIKDGYAEYLDESVQVAIDKEKRNYPIMIDGYYYDVDGVKFDPEIHGKSGNKPAVKVSGAFKRKRGITEEFYQERLRLQNTVAMPGEEDTLPQVVVGDEEGTYDDDLKKLMEELGN